MSEQQPGSYKLDHAQPAKDQVRTIATYAKTIRRSRVLGRLMRKAMHLLQTDPHGWGDPQYRAKTVDAVACRGILPPLVFHYVIYEQTRSVVLSSVKLYADFE
jgi:hypothetical protein